jgi:hypothetical protein
VVLDKATVENSKKKISNFAYAMTNKLQFRAISGDDDLAPEEDENAKNFE